MLAFGPQLWHRTCIRECEIQKVLFPYVFNHWGVLDWMPTTIELSLCCESTQKKFVIPIGKRTSVAPSVFYTFMKRQRKTKIGCYPLWTFVVAGALGTTKDNEAKPVIVFCVLLPFQVCHLHKLFTTIFFYNKALKIQQQSPLTLESKDLPLAIH